MKPENLSAAVLQLWQEIAVWQKPTAPRHLIQQVLQVLAPSLSIKAAYFKHTYARQNPVVDADDLVQDAVIAVLDALSRAQNRTNQSAPLTYLLSAADYAMLKGAFAGARGEIRLDDLPDNIPQLVFEWTQNTDARIVLDAALQLLPPKLEQLVRLRYWDRLTQAETGKRMCLSQGRVAQMEKQALERLKATLTI